MLGEGGVHPQIAGAVLYLVQAGAGCNVEEGVQEDLHESHAPSGRLQYVEGSPHRVDCIQHAGICKPHRLHCDLSVKH